MDQARMLLSQTTAVAPDANLQPPMVVPASPQTQQDLERLDQAALKFEAFFVAQMMKQMRQATAALTAEDSALNREVNQAPLAMADMAVADALAGQRAFGIADVLVRQMSGAWSISGDAAANTQYPRNLT